jgi:hypothetical protein
LPQEPSFGIRAYGFPTKEAYENNIHRLGNLTLLERGLNSACNNQSVETKMNDKGLYRASSYQMTQALAATGATSKIAFSREQIEARCTDIADLCVMTWPIY